MIETLASFHRLLHQVPAWARGIGITARPGVLAKMGKTSLHLFKDLQLRLPVLAALALFHAGGISFAAPAAKAPGEEDGDAILNAYFAAAQKSQEDLRGYTMKVKMEGALP